MKKINSLIKIGILIIACFFLFSLFYNKVFATVGVDWSETTSNAGWAAREAAGVLVFNNKMWTGAGLAGSFFDPASFKSDVWYSTDGVNWTAATENAPWSGRIYFSFLVFNNKLWVIGGSDGTGPSLNDVWYSTDGANWTQATAHANWTGKWIQSAVVFDNKMWVMGGYDELNSVRTNDVWYSTDGANWTQATARADWQGRSEFGLLVFDNKMWVIGGRDDTDNINDVWYSTNGINWTQAISNAPWLERNTNCMTVFNNKMWLLGGLDTFYVQRNDVWSSSSDIWNP